EAFNALAKQEIYRSAGVKGFGAQDLRFGGGIRDEGLGQRRLVIGQFGLVADQPDAALITFLAQARGRLHAPVTRSDDDDTVCHVFPRLLPSTPSLQLRCPQAACKGAFESHPEW